MRLNLLIIKPVSFAIIIIAGFSGAKAADPPIPDGVVDAFAKLATEYLTHGVAAGIAQVKANNFAAVDDDTVVNWSYFLGERQVNLNCEVKNEEASAKVDVTFQLTSRKEGSLTVSDDTDANAGPPKEGERNPQTASFQWAVSLQGQLIYSDKKVVPVSLQLLSVSPFDDRVTVASLSSLGFVPLLPDLDPDLTLFSPNWDYWEPLILNGSSTPDDAWTDTLQLLSLSDWDAQSISIASDLGDEDAAIAYRTPDSLNGLYAVFAILATMFIGRRLGRH